VEVFPQEQPLNENPGAVVRRRGFYPNSQLATVAAPIHQTARMAETARSDARRVTSPRSPLVLRGA